MRSAASWNGSPHRRPLVSIAIPVYNGASALDDAISSAVSQTYQPLEIVVVDNASTDATPEIVRRWMDRDRRIRYARNACNVGLSANFRRSLEAARGTYFTWLAHDDRLDDPRAIEIQVEYLERHPDVVLCASDVHRPDVDTVVQPITIALGELYPDRCPREARRHFFQWPQHRAYFAIYGVYRREPLLRAMHSIKIPASQRPLLCPEVPILTRLLAEGRIVALPMTLRTCRVVYPSESWRLALDLTPFELSAMGLRVKLTMLAHAARLPIPLVEKVELVLQALAGLTRANFERPTDVRPTLARFIPVLGGLIAAADERKDAIASLRAEIQKRRLAHMCGEDGAGSAAPDQEDVSTSDPHEPDIADARSLPAEAARALRPLQSVLSFFRRPPKSTVDLCVELRHTVSVLQRICDERLAEIDRLSAEAEALLRRAPARSSDGGMMPSAPERTSANRLYAQTSDVALLRALLQRLANKTVIDVGAELGEVSAELLAAGASRLVAVEPHPGNAAALRERFASDPRVTVLQLAVGERDEQATLHVARDKTGSLNDALHSLNPYGETEYVEWIGTVEVSCRTLASLVRDLQLPPDVGILKIDTERLDLAVIRGLGPLTASVIVVEYWVDIPHLAGSSPYRVQDVAEILAERGFRDFVRFARRGRAEMLRVNDPLPRSGEWGNVVFIHERVRDAVLPVVYEHVELAQSRLADELERLGAVELASIEKEGVIQALSIAAEERLQVIEALQAENGKRETLIQDLAAAAEDRLRVIEVLQAEIDRLRQRLDALSPVPDDDAPLTVLHPLDSPDSDVLERRDEALEGAPRLRPIVAGHGEWATGGQEHSAGVTLAPASSREHPCD
ncbi:MAG: FkbM family methyltransferase [Chloroflexota bacterium]